MPHLYLEYSAGLAAFDATTALQACELALRSSGQFDSAAIQVHLGCPESPLGAGAAPGAFVRMQLRLLVGDFDAQRPLAKALLNALQPLIPNNLPVQLSVECVEVEPAHYAKAVFHG